MNCELNFNNLPDDIKDHIFSFNRSSPERLVLRKRAMVRYYFWRWFAFCSPRSGYNRNISICNLGALGAVAPFMGIFENPVLDEDLENIHREKGLWTVGSRSRG